MKCKFKLIPIIIVGVMLASVFNSCKEEEAKDVFPPIIKLSGNDNISLPLNSTYVEPGYFAEDNVDGDITDNVEIENSLNVNLTGTYTIEYSIIDTEGNTNSVSRTITIYNQANFIESGYKGEVAYPYPGSASVIFYDSITPSTTKNYEVTFKNFANTQEQVLGTLVPLIDGVYTLQFDDQGSFTNINSITVETTDTELFFNSYTMNSSNGQFTLIKQ